MSLRRSQQGVALFVCLIMLMIITLLAMASFRLGKADLQISGNMQLRNQGLAAAQSAVEQVISSTQFTATPTNALPNPCSTGPNTACVDVNGDGVPDVNVTVVVSCLAVQPIPNASLNYNLPSDAGCTVGAGQTNGIVGSANGNSLCANSVWDTQATATDTVTNAQYTVNQGVGVRVPISTVCP
jgi:hypothetical protein